MTKMGKLLHWIAFARVILPITLRAAGVPADIADHATAIAGDAEAALGDGTGPDKLAAVADGVRHAMQAKGASATTVQATVDAVSAGLATGIKLTNDIHTIAAGHAGAGV